MPGGGRRCRMLPGGASGAACCAAWMIRASVAVPPCRLCRHCMPTKPRSRDGRLSSSAVRYSPPDLLRNLRASGPCGILRALPYAPESLAPAVATITPACIGCRRHAHHPLRSALRSYVTRSGARHPSTARHPPSAWSAPPPRPIRKSGWPSRSFLTPRPHYRAAPSHSLDCHARPWEAPYRPMQIPRGAKGRARCLS